jgi:orotate phosphoribosyltransferase-like protein
MSYPERRPAGPPAAATPSAGAPGRSSKEIRRDIEVQREELGRSVDALRTRVGELTDWRRQLREHRRELVMGAAIAGFAIGGLVALRRRR